MILDLCEFDLFNRVAFNGTCAQLTGLGFRLVQQKVSNPEPGANSKFPREPDYLAYIDFPDKLGRAIVKGTKVTHVRVNLGRLFHGNRAKVLRNEAELTGAFEKLWHLLDKFSYRDGPLEIVRATSLEVGWNFAKCFRDIEPLLGPCRHPWIRKRPRLIQGMEWSLRGDLFGLKIYNKGKLLVEQGELNILPNGDIPHCTRLEVFLRKKKLKAELKRAGINGIPTFEQLKNVMHYALSLMTTPAVLKASSQASVLATLIAHLAIEKKIVGGMDPLAFVTQGMKMQRARALRKRVAGIIFEQTSFTIPSLFGNTAGAWPPPFDAE